MEKLPQSTPFRDAYSIKSRASLTFPAQGKTVQSFKDECDVNQIMARYQSTGELPNLNSLPPQFLDVTGADFQAHQNAIAQAQTLFNELPSAIRTRFQNSPAAFLDFCSNENNRQELAEMGLLRPIEAPSIPAPHLTPSNPTTGLKTSPDTPA